MGNFIGTWYELIFCMLLTMLLLNCRLSSSLINPYCGLQIRHETASSDIRLPQDCAWSYLNCTGSGQASQKSSPLFQDPQPSLDLTKIRKIRITGRKSRESDELMLRHNFYPVSPSQLPTTKCASNILLCILWVSVQYTVCRTINSSKNSFKFSSCCGHSSLIIVITHCIPSSLQS